MPPPRPFLPALQGPPPLLFPTPARAGARAAGGARCSRPWPGPPHNSPARRRTLGQPSPPPAPRLRQRLADGCGAGAGRRPAAPQPPLQRLLEVRHQKLLRIGQAAKGQAHSAVQVTARTMGPGLRAASAAARPGSSAVPGPWRRRPRGRPRARAAPGQFQCCSRRAWRCKVVVRRRGPRRGSLQPPDPSPGLPAPSPRCWCKELSEVRAQVPLWVHQVDWSQLACMRCAASQAAFPVLAPQLIQEPASPRAGSVAGQG
mmetsp:Transcript_75578/g.182637  ORF Transcript_75578/g.182637 Transcript_75578/m.182637 type:complete len:259 (+) Transcript_75578:159-935(+)